MSPRFILFQKQDNRLFFLKLGGIIGGIQLKPIVEREAFKKLLDHGFTEAGCTHQLLSESAIELIRMASQGNPRRAHQLIVTSLRLATDKKINHLPDDIVHEAITLLKQV